MALVHVDFFSEVLEMSSQLDVILPQKTQGEIGISTAQNREQYPVLYLLHGMTDNQSTWQRNTSIERYAAEKGIAVVMPCCHLGWYTDMKYGFRYFTYISQEVPDICKRFFPRISPRREDTFVAGNSMGGYGALKLALSRPDRFCSAASLSGGVDAASCALRNNKSFYPTLGEDIFGPEESIPGSSNDLFALAENLSPEKRPNIYMWCGTEDFLYQQNLKFRDHLRNLSYNLTYKESFGDHSWKYWDIQIQDILNWMFPDRKGEK
ncbi:MAG TPA: esterase family protein [Candidatus Pullilachnospira intestinigallinarum]|nr:esterase family protein [Candidatus Pullilachnospira intestinigallinarum]